MEFTLRDNQEKKRLEMDIDSGTAFAAYEKLDEHSIAINYVEVPREKRGLGYGAKLMDLVMEHIKDQGKKVLPKCSYAMAYIDRNPHWHGITLGRATYLS